MDAYKIYKEGMMGYSNKKRYFLTLDLAEKAYQQLIEEVKKEHEGDILTDEELEETLLGFKKNLCEQKLRSLDGAIIKRFLIAFEYTSSTEDGTEYYEDFSTIVLEKIKIEEK